jgi:hypothetical protein
MRIRAFGRAAAIGISYIAIFMVLVVIQFPSKGPIITVAGGISFKGLPSNNGEGLRSAELSANGLRLVFSERYPLLLQSASGKERRILPVSYKAMEKGFSILFDDGTRLVANADMESDGRASWQILPKDVAAAFKATMRYELAYGAAMIAPGENGALRLSFSGATYGISGAKAGTEPRTLTMEASKGTLKPFVSIREEEGKPASPTQFLAQAPMDQAAWNKELSDWREKAWLALSGPAFNAAAATWSNGQGTPGEFNEAFFTAYMAEALRRDAKDAAAALVPIVRGKFSALLTWKSSPFAGKTAVTMAAFEEATLAQVKTIERQVQTRSPALFYTEGIVPLLFDRSPYSLAQEAMSLARTLDFSRADVTQAIALIEAYLDARRYMSEEENPFIKAIELVDKTIAPAVRKAEGGFFLHTGSDGACDALAGLAAGKALIRLATAVDKPIYAGIGQSLVLGFLRLAEADGSIPKTVTILDGTMTRSRERLSAAAVYPVVADSPYYPHAVSFYKELGPGTWAWTCSPAMRVQSSPESTIFTANFPVGYSHYLTLYGVKPFVKIQLYGLDYNMDSGFESYNASGYFYKKAAGAMYLKMRHKTQGEEVRLFY